LTLLPVVRLVLLLSFSKPKADAVATIIPTIPAFYNHSINIR